MSEGYTEFEFDLPGALLDRLVTVLDGMEAAPLNSGNTALIPETQGVYQLFLGGKLVYIGKTDADAGLSQRLERHGKKILHRSGLDPDRASFKAVRVYVFTAVDLEKQLIAHYGGDKTVRWNGSGFGSNDPGRRRDATVYKAGHFDTIFPIDIDRSLGIALEETAPASAALTDLKSALPYVFRFENAGPRSRKPHPDLESAMVTVTASGPVSARWIIEQVVPQLPSGWQATKLPSHIILYKEESPYPHGAVIARSV